jgi:uncharacterized protein (DUF1015 family)
MTDGLNDSDISKLSLRGLTMATIKPFRALRYNLQKVELEKVVAPPYDVISPDQQNGYYEVSPYNVIRLILGREEDRYASAAHHLNAWLKDEILIHDEEPALYMLAQTFIGTDGNTITRKGFIGACELVELDKGVVLPHEKTLSKPKADRFNLMKATRTNFSQIFGLYSDPDHGIDDVTDAISKLDPIIDIEFEEVNNKVWRIDRPEDVEFISNAMKDKQILIADGHHRYETALAYRDLMRNENPSHAGNELYNYVMMFCTNMYDPGLVIYPTHRVLHSLQNFNGAVLLNELKKYYVVEEIASGDELRKKLAAVNRYAFGYVYPGSYNLVYLREPGEAVKLLPADMPEEVKALDVALLHSHIIGTLLGISVEAQEQKLFLDYIKDFGEAVKAVGEGTVQAALLMNPTPIDQVRSVAEAGYTMPQKSTYFYPKLVSGLVFNPLQ